MCAAPAKTRTMASSRIDPRLTQLETLVSLAQLLERVEPNVAVVGADQYLSLVRQVQRALGDEGLPADALPAVLDAFPATATIYENLHYGQAGLSRSSLERSVASEMLACQLLARAARHTA